MRSHRVFRHWNCVEDSVLGVLGHECGHQNYSSIYLRKKYVEGISNGILYPYFPEPRSEKERLHAEADEGTLRAERQDCNRTLSDHGCTPSRIAGRRLYRRTYDEKVPGKYPERDTGESKTYYGTLRQRKKAG